MRSQAEAGWLLRAAVHLDCRNMVPDFITGPFSIGLAAGAPVFLVGPENHAQSTSRTQTQLVDEVRGFEGGDAARAIVLRARAHIPGINVATDDYNLFRPFAAGNLSDDVSGIRVRQ